jgi:glycosyltransferase involved in cell wall biosynthesis
MPRPTFSVVIPTFDRVDYLARSVGSVLGQTFGDLEVIVVDDGPTEAIARFARSHRDERVRLVRHVRNRGVAAARNTGVEAAEGRYVAFLDDDDLWLPTKLERQLRLIEDEGAEVVHTLVYVADAEGNVFEAPSRRGFELFREVAAAGYPYEWLLRRSSFFFGTFAVRKACVESVGGFDEQLARLDDLDFVHRLRRRYDLHLVDEPLVKHCYHGRNLSARPDPALWPRLAAKELGWLGQANPPGRDRIEAYLCMQVAQSAWIASNYRHAIRPSFRARRLDPAVISARTMLKYVVAACLPAFVVEGARRWARSRRVPRDPDPWLDLP